MSAPDAATETLKGQRRWLLAALDRETERVSGLSRSIVQAGENITQITSELASIEAAIVTLGGTVDGEEAS